MCEASSTSTIQITSDEDIIVGILARRVTNNVRIGKPSHPMSRGTNPGTHFSCFARSSVRSTHGAFDDVKTCIDGRTPGSLSNRPAGTLTMPVASVNFGAGEPH